MTVLGDLPTHVQLASRMAKTTEVDLTKAYDTGALPHEEWADMVQTCRRCQWAGRCDGWLDTHPQAETAPPTCLNRDRFARLKQSQD